MKHIIDRLAENHNLTKEEWHKLITSYDEEVVSYAAQKAKKNRPRAVWKSCVYSWTD